MRGRASPLPRRYRRGGSCSASPLSRSFRRSSFAAPPAGFPAFSARKGPVPGAVDQERETEEQAADQQHFAELAGSRARRHQSSSSSPSVNGSQPEAYRSIDDARSALALAQR